MTPEDVRSLRKRLGMLEGEFSQLLAVSPRTVYRWEAGNNEAVGTAGAVLRAVHEVLTRHPTYGQQVIDLLVRASKVGGLAYLLIFLLETWLSTEKRKAT